MRTKILEATTILASIFGILLSLSHGNLYGYFIDYSGIEGFAYFKMLYLSLLLYSFLALVVFSSLLFLKERKESVRFLSYIQGWLFLIIAAFAFEWLDAMMIWSTQMMLSNRFIEYPYTFLAKGASVIFFSALFLFWIVENKKRSLKS